MDFPANFLSRVSDPCHVAAMSDAQLRKQVHTRQGAYLPHWTLDGAIYHVVFRLADSLPAKLVEQYRAERDALLQVSAANDPDSPERPGTAPARTV